MTEILPSRAFAANREAITGLGQQLKDNRSARQIFLDQIAERQRWIETKDAEATVLETALRSLRAEYPE